jgi:3',5'-cyclic AMP phosphodiesterase CpdA
MRLLAISDLHLGDPVNRECFASIGASPDDWLILAGDVSETEADLALAFGHLRSRFARVIWVPGNHELWTTDSTPGAIRGEARYQALVALARSFGVVTPEDPYPIWPVELSPNLGDGRDQAAA